MEAPTNQFTWPPVPYPAFLATIGVTLLGAVMIAAAKHFDPTGGPLALSVLVIIAFIAATFASMIYTIPQVPSTEMLVGGLATALGATIAYWLGRK